MIKLQWNFPRLCDKLIRSISYIKWKIKSAHYVAINKNWQAFPFNNLFSRRVDHAPSFNAVDLWQAANSFWAISLSPAKYIWLKFALYLEDQHSPSHLGRRYRWVPLYSNMPNPNPEIGSPSKIISCLCNAKQPTWFKIQLIQKNFAWY